MGQFKLMCKYDMNAPTEIHFWNQYIKTLKNWQVRKGPAMNILEAGMT